MMIETEDWSKLYYAIIRIKANKTIDVLGVGSTKMLCRTSTLNNIMESRTQITGDFLHLLESLDVEKSRKRYFGGCEYAMVYCEAKVYIYGKRYGYNEMLAVYDPTYREDLVRFAGYRKKPKGVK